MSTNNLQVRKYSFNTVEVLLHYMTTSIIGPKIPDNEIDITGTFANAARISEQVVQEDVSLKGKFYGEEVTRDLRRHEFHGLIYPDVDHISNIEKILNTIPGAIIFRSADGLIKISIPDPLAGTASEQAIEVITDDVLVGDLEFAQTDTDSRLNQVKLNFRNLSKDFASDSFELISEKFKAEDRGIPLVEESTIDGVNNVYQAERLAHAILESSRLPYISFKTSHQMFRLEPGDIVRVFSERNEASTIVRILSTKLNDDFTISFETYIYDPLAYDKEESELTILYNDNPFGTSRKVPVPTGLSLNLIDNTASIVKSVMLTFEPSDDMNVREYEIQSAVSVSGEVVYSTVARILDDANVSNLSRLSVIHSPNYIEEYSYRVRARTANGSLSAWSAFETITVTIDAVSGDNPALLFSDSTPRATPVNTNADGAAMYTFNALGYRGPVVLRIDATGFESTSLSLNGQLLEPLTGNVSERKSHMVVLEIDQDINTVRIWSSGTDTGTIHSVSAAIVAGGKDGVSIDIILRSSSGTVFRNNLGTPKTISADVYLNGIKSTNTTGYRYKWFANNSVMYVDSGGSMFGTAPGGGLFAADGELGSANNFSEIIIDPTDVSDGGNLNLACEVSNI